MLRSLYAIAGITLIAGAFWLGRTSGDRLAEAAMAPPEAAEITAPAHNPAAPAGDERALAATTLDDGTIRLENPGQALRADYTRDGVAMSAGADTPGSWTLRTTAFGYGATMTDLPEAEPRAMDNYLEYVRGDVIEWYLNRADGIEQGYTIIAPPQGGDGATRLAVRVEVDGDLDLEVQEDSQIVTLRDAEDNAVLAMSDFLAHDARGNILPMTVTLDERPGAIRFEVDDHRAYYPVTIDPMFRRGKLAPILEWIDDNRDGTCTAHFGYLNTVGKWSQADIQAWKDRRASAARYDFLVARVERIRARAEAGRRWAIRWLERKADLIAHLDSLVDYQEWRWQRFLSRRSERARERILEGRRVWAGTRRNYFSPAPKRRGQPRRFEAGRQVDVFQVVFSEDTIVWNLCGRTSTASKSAARRSVYPIVEYVQENYDGSYTAHWGYLNENRDPVTIPVGGDNKITPHGPDHGQATAFQVGRVYDAFQTDFSGGRQNWTLEGPDGRRRVACAGADNARPYVGETLHIFVDDVYENWDGSITAVFGYLNKNDHPVTIPIGPDNRLSPSDHNGPQTVDFIAGRMDGAWTITWPGDHNLVWTLKGPDQKTRTTTAGVDAARPYDPEPVHPVFEYLTVDTDGEVVAHWGYFNKNHHPVEITIGAGNKFSPGPDRGQPTIFAAGRNYDVFTTVIDCTTVWNLDGRSATAGYPIRTLYFENFTMQGGTHFRRPVESFGWYNRAGNTWEAAYAAEHGQRAIYTGRKSVNSVPYKGPDAQDGALYTSNRSTNQLLATEEYTGLDISQIQRVSFQQSSGPDSAFYLALKIDGAWYAGEPWVATYGDGNTSDNTFNQVDIDVTNLLALPLTVIPPGPGLPEGMVDLDQNARPVDLPANGTVEAFGIYFHRGYSVNKRVIDEFEIYGSTVVPTPVVPTGIAALRCGASAYMN